MRHKKSGHVYRVMALAVREADLEPVVSYSGDDGLIWIRPASEFFDGRFEVYIPTQRPMTEGRFH
ncbi:hypothetical protein DSS3P1_71 [Ruegeria phage DSS3-P1]|nr:hypothetical protein DSS3P1_71 [Ruegeria phage DSS3-P1]YP_009997288.1 hypothetical protein JT312_gp71 [Ruegeria phage vB_RpoS-V18]YP_009997370.1 hypothetical protein JT313_gp71 [Ruegeria phage vB_RpoS-V11]YP_009997454.1 hypothetical protein JT314_gp73 [Ruegeria phage vB_RpoS-V7]AIT13306.1 hypothetical protein DSS3P1_71 [Ruegeria phage DSS3-P1]AWY08776.1 hypothetical protein vBRpoSV7_73 [Ruegeria phage vB_RpoS-V7]AWY08947.1 hypothetical protein vBRpoSV18_71 [Ruegeria phage vB_RpoS-V18]AWY0